MLDGDVAAAQATSSGDTGWVTVAIESVCSSEKAIARDIYSTASAVTAALGVDVAHLNIIDRVESDVTTVASSCTRVKYPSRDTLFR